MIIHRVREQLPIVVERDVPMVTRDGVTLFADVARPDMPGRFPVLISRTPYGKQFAMDNPNGSNQYFARHGYVSIMQDCRGRFTSEGNY
ncbi:MAG: CocE/NonD family hydrolase, partial [Dehalococcoidia bacterium]